MATAQRGAAGGLHLHDVAVLGGATQLPLPPQHGAGQRPAASQRRVLRKPRQHGGQAPPAQQPQPKARTAALGSSRPSASGSAALPWSTAHAIVDDGDSDSSADAALAALLAAGPDLHHTVYREQTLYEKLLLSLGAAYRDGAVDQLDAADADAPNVHAPTPPTATAAALAAVDNDAPLAAARTAAATTYYPSTRAGLRRSSSARAGGATGAAAARRARTVRGRVTALDAAADVAALAAVVGVEPAAVEDAYLRSLLQRQASQLGAGPSAAAATHGAAAHSRVAGAWPAASVAAPRRHTMGRAAPVARAAGLPTATAALAAGSSAALLSREQEGRLVEAYQHARALLRLQAELAQRLGRAPSAAELAAAADLADAGAVVTALAAGQAARARLLRGNVRLVMKIAHAHMRRLQAGGCDGNVSVQDLVAVGMEGLEKGLARFDTSLGYKLSTYVYWYILQAITYALAELQFPYHLPSAAMEQLHTLRSAVRELQEELGREPTTAEVQGKSGLCAAAMSRLQRLRRRRELALEARSSSRTSTGGYSDESSGSLGDVIPDPTQSDPSEAAEAAGAKDAVMSVVERALPPRELAVVRAVYGLESGARMTQREVAAQLGISFQRVGQLRLQALQRLRRVAAYELSELCGNDSTPLMRAAVRSALAVDKKARRGAAAADKAARDAVPRSGKRGRKPKAARGDAAPAGADAAVAFA